MKIVLLTHPDFLPSQSMPRYAQWLAEGMKKRGYQVHIWQPKPICYRLPVPQALKKWMGYIDQFFLFPFWIKKQLRRHTPDTLYVFTDHALGPWVPYLARFPHLIHCHDFLAQRSALGEIPENPTGFTGKVYQAYIRRGYKKGKNFISISEKTKADLHRFLTAKPEVSAMVYNGLTRDFNPVTEQQAVKDNLAQAFNINLTNGFILHVGGNQWYKNRRGVIELYSAWRKLTASQLPLILIGAPPNEAVMTTYRQSAYQHDIFFLTGVNDTQINHFYGTADVLLFPSLAEGFGWPIIEAMASGCPVITTNDAPMNEVGGDAAIYIDKRPNGDSEATRHWALAAATVLENVIHHPHSQQLVRKGLLNAKRFDAENALDNIETIYKQLFAHKR